MNNAKYMDIKNASTNDTLFNEINSANKWYSIKELPKFY